MLETIKALFGFYSQFGLPVYTTDNVPDWAEIPYITFRFADSDWEQPISHYCIIYMRTEDNELLLGKAEEIKAAIGTGLRLPCEGGCIYLHYENAEIMSETDTGDPDVRGVYINMQLQVLHS